MKNNIKAYAKYIVILCLCFFSSKAQTWNPVNKGITGVAANITWSLYADDSILFTGGYFDTAGGVAVNNIAQWNGANWSTVGLGSTGYINAMMYYNGYLYAGGYFDTIGGIVAHDIARWDGTKWSPVGNGIGIRTQEYGVFSMAVYKGELYIGGSFDSIDGKQIFGIAKWNDTAWSAIGTGIYSADEDDAVFAMTVYNGELYAAGGIDSAGGVPVSEIAKWNGTKWSAVGTYTNGPMYAMAVYNGNLYVGGWADTIGGVVANSIAMWNGSTFTPLDSGLYGEPGGSQLSALAVYNGALYAGGYFDSVNGKAINCIAQWDGSKWNFVGNVNVGGDIDVMTVYQNSLYVGGGFDSIGGVYAQNIAMYTNPNSIASIYNKSGISVYPDPAQNTVYINCTQIKDAHISLYNSLGQLIDEKPLPSSSAPYEMNIGDLSAGLYMVRITDGSEVYTAKFIKE